MRARQTGRFFSRERAHVGAHEQKAVSGDKREAVGWSWGHAAPTALSASGGMEFYNPRFF